MLLYHYTKYNSFISIITDKQFALSSFENANDYKDKYALKHFDFSKLKYLSCCKEKNVGKISLMSWSNSMMWYHYAGNYSGVCIEFDGNKILNDFSDKILVNGNVIYRDGVTHIDKQICENDLKGYVLEKRRCWIGEDEYRIVFKNLDRISDISNYINLVYVGSCISDDNFKKLVDLVNGKFQIHKMNTDKTDGRQNRF